MDPTTSSFSTIAVSATSPSIAVFGARTRPSYGVSRSGGASRGRVAGPLVAWAVIAAGAGIALCAFVSA